MNTSGTRVTRARAAAVTGVSERTIQRLAAAGHITVERDTDFRKPALYVLEEVRAAVATHVRGHRGLPPGS